MPWGALENSFSPLVVLREWILETMGSVSQDGRGLDETSVLVDVSFAGIVWRRLWEREIQRVGGI